MMAVADLLGNLDEAALAEARRTIPFDYAFRYQLTGKPSTVLNSTVTVSIEATFVAVAIGYGVVPKISPAVFGAVPPGQPGVILAATFKTARAINLGAIVGSIQLALPETERRLRDDTIVGAVLKRGLRLNPQFADIALIALERDRPLEPSILAKMFQVVGPPSDRIQFLYALFDEGSGREFQGEPILNTAGLGISNGDRPFRYFPRPIVFKPRSTIRLQITEISDFQGELHISLQGYKVLGGAGTPTAIARRGPRRR
jgi:hypothetical protein